MKPKYLFRFDDGERFTLQPNGYFTMDNSEMDKKYQYTRQYLLREGFVDSLDKCVIEKYVSKNMTKNELIKKLQEISGNPEVEVKYSYFNCTGHGPDEYCYCGNEEKQEPISYLVLEERDFNTGKKMKEKKIVIYL